mgnify:CR=1 FL=1
MKPITCFFICTLYLLGAYAQDAVAQVTLTNSDPALRSHEVRVMEDEEGFRLLVDGKEFMINGMNWDYFPIGTNFSYSLWKQSDELIKEALDAEMAMLKSMGVNARKRALMFDSNRIVPQYLSYYNEVLNKG